MDQLPRTNFRMNAVLKADTGNIYVKYVSAQSCRITAVVKTMKLVLINNWCNKIVWKPLLTSTNKSCDCSYTALYRWTINHTIIQIAWSCNFLIKVKCWLNSILIKQRNALYGPQQMSHRQDFITVFQFKWKLWCKNDNLYESWIKSWSYYLSKYPYSYIIPPYKIQNLQSRWSYQTK